MIITYVSSAMDREDFEDLFRNASFIPGQQAQKYNRLLIEGFSLNQVKVHAFTSRPVNNRNVKKLWIKKHIRKKDLITYHYSGLINLPVIKNIFQFIATFFCVLKDSGQGNNVVVTDVLNATVALAASYAARLKKRPCIGIVTDMPELMVTGSRSGFCRIVRKTISLCTGYVFLTQAMNDALNPMQKPYAIIEGLCDSQQTYSEIEKDKTNTKILLYAGLLDERYGVKRMVEGFLSASVENAELHIYGDGPYAEELAKVARAHKNIKYHGVVMNREIMQAEKKADLLINPRPSCEDFVKYSFPSKNLEYMSSGTPVLTTKLPGMPVEYYPHVFLLEEETTEGFSEELREILSLSEQELLEKGRSARSFVFMYKNNTVQAEKILGLAQSCAHH